MDALTPRATVGLFAAALDRCDFDEARNYLASDCRYEIGGKELLGADAVLASYRESAKWADHALEHVSYESRVEESAGGLSVLYTDHIRHHGRTHLYRCRQYLAVQEGRIIRIVHEELPGERERLEQFFTSCGVSR